jgi:NADPH:quinone reductase
VAKGSRWQVGDEVMTLALPFGERRGAYAEYLIAADDAVARVPAGTGLMEAATIPMNGLTATQIIELLDLPVGSTIAVT